MKQETITVQVIVRVPVALAWEYFTLPEHITQWNYASADWECPSASNDLRVGGVLRARMQARGSGDGFDFEGVYTEVVPKEYIAYAMSDGRQVRVTFKSVENGLATVLTETFDPEHDNPITMQQDGWQAILNNFKTYAESRAR